MGKQKRTKIFVRDNTDKHSPINSSMYIKDSFPLNRQNMDKHTVDEQGKLILGLCKSSALRILNGRVLGDENGSFTRHPSNLTDNPSVIDYALCSASLSKEVKYCSLLPFTGLSDHCCISITIKYIISMEFSPPIAKNKEDETLKTKKFILLSMIRLVSICTKKPFVKTITLKNLGPS